MATNPQQELIWQGRLHLGDEPGIYGDSHYSGIATELPITVYRIDPTSAPNLSYDLILETEHVETYGGYPGHEIIVITYEPDPAKPYHSVERTLAQERLVAADNNRKAVQISSGTRTGPFLISVRLRADTSVNPGFYNDFVFIRLSLVSRDFYSQFGFRNP